MPAAPHTTNPLQIRDQLVAAILKAADPARAVTDAKLPRDFHPRALIATGKASAPMVEAALARLGDQITTGTITCVPTHEQRLRTACAHHPSITIHPADHPLATPRNRAAADAIARKADELASVRTDTLVLISGGASAHLTSPAGSLTLDDLRTTTDALLRAGATIRQLNAVRKHCETLKGGRLARRLAPARAHVLVLSDVLGDPLDTIGSGPTAPDPTTFADARAVLDEFPNAPVPAAVRDHLAAAADETPKPGDPCFETISHTVIANNDAARAAAERALTSLGFPIVESRARVEGEAAEVARDLVRTLASAPPPSAVVFGGETTVTVGNAPGLGGRNQELALAAAIELAAIPCAAVLTLATDGIDGPTDAAGALVTTDSVRTLESLGTDPRAALARHDSHTALEAAGSLIRTGPTGTNINDVAVAIRW
jgi:glycerate 2-kinase